MNNTEFNALFEATIKTCSNIMVHKGGEYAHGTDRLDNFKRNAKDLQLMPEEVWAIYFRKHLDAITTYITDLRKGVNRPRSESITGRFDDAINYLLLGKALIVEREQQNAKSVQVSMPEMRERKE